MSIAEKLTKIAENEQKVYKAGFRKGAEQGGGGDSSFMDIYQDYGEKTDYMYAFCHFDDTTFKPNYDMQPTCAIQMFRYSKVTNLEQILLDRGIKLDFSQARRTLTGTLGAGLGSFVANSSITHLPLIEPPSDVANTTIFQNASELKSIRGIKLTPRYAVEHKVEGVEPVYITLIEVDMPTATYTLELSRAVPTDINVEIYVACDLSNGWCWEHQSAITVPANITSHTFCYVDIMGEKDAYITYGGVSLTDGYGYGDTFALDGKHAIYTFGKEVDAPSITSPATFVFASSSFTGCVKLEEIHEISSSTEKHGDYAVSQDGGVYSQYFYLGLIDKYINVSDCKKLSRETLLRISEALVNYRRNDIDNPYIRDKLNGESGTCIFGATNLAKLTEKEITAITDKGWSVS